MKRILLFTTLTLVSACASSPYVEIYDELPPEGIHTIKVGERDCIIAYDDDDALDMECFDNIKPKYEHQVTIKRQ